jgi:hypothetical protein
VLLKVLALVLTAGDDEEVAGVLYALDLEIVLTAGGEEDVGEVFNQTRRTAGGDRGRGHCS